MEECPQKEFINSKQAKFTPPSIDLYYTLKNRAHDLGITLEDLIEQTIVKAFPIRIVNCFMHDDSIDKSSYALKDSTGTVWIANNFVHNCEIPIITFMNEENGDEIEVDLLSVEYDSKGYIIPFTCVECGYKVHIVEVISLQRVL